MQNLIINEGYKKDVDLFYGAQGEKFSPKIKNILIYRCAQDLFY